MCNLFIIRNVPTKSERHLKAISIIYMVFGITWNILTTHSNGVFFLHGIKTFVIPWSFCQPKLAFIFSHNLLSLLCCFSIHVFRVDDSMFCNQ